MHPGVIASTRFAQMDGQTDWTDEQTDRLTDGQPKNIIPPAPKVGGGIKEMILVTAKFDQL